MKPLMQVLNNDLVSSYSEKNNNNMFTRKLYWFCMIWKKTQVFSIYFTDKWMIMSDLIYSESTRKVTSGHSKHRHWHFSLNMWHTTCMNVTQLRLGLSSYFTRTFFYLNTYSTAGRSFFNASLFRQMRVHVVCRLTAVSRMHW